MVYQVGRPAMFEGKRFLPETGTPIWKMLRSRTVFELWEPEPFTVATWMLMSLTTGFCARRPPRASRSATSVVAMDSSSHSGNRTRVAQCVVSRICAVRTEEVLLIIRHRQVFWLVTFVLPAPVLVSGRGQVLKNCAMCRNLLYRDPTNSPTGLP